MPRATPDGGGSATKRLTGEQIGVLCWSNAKWRPEGKEAQIAWLDNCIAVALAESGGNINAVSSTGDYGLFQINQKAHPRLFAELRWEEPADNVEMARRVYAAAGNKWSPWAVYGGSRYLSYKGQGRAIWEKINAPATPENPEGGKSFVNQVLSTMAAPFVAAGGVVGDVAGGIKDGVQGGASIITNKIQGALKDTFGFLKEAGVVIGAFLLVIVMLILGLYLLVGKQAVKNLSPIGALTGGK